MAARGRFLTGSTMGHVVRMTMAGAIGITFVFLVDAANLYWISKLGQPGYVFYSTIKSFKGLECRHVIFIHADKPDVTQALAKEDLYVAFTRASARLDVVTANLEAAEWLSSLRLTLV